MASELAKKLHERRNTLWSEARGIAETPLDEKRDMTAEEQGRFEGINVEIDSLDKRIKEILAAEQRSKDADEAFNRIGNQPVNTGGLPASPSYQKVFGGDRKTKNDELRAMIRREPGAPQFVDIAPSENARILGTQNRLAELRTLSTATTGAGGNLLPTDFYDQLIAHLIEVSGIMQAGPTVINTAGGETLQIPKTTAHTTASSAAQAGTLTEVDPTFGLTTLSAYKYAAYIQVSRELIDDQGVDLLGYLAMSCGRAIGNKFGSDLVTGTGGGVQPNGLLNLAPIGVTGTTGKAGAPQYADLVNMEYSVIAPYRQSKSAYWIAADKTIGGFRLLVDGNQRPIWEPSMVLGSPDLLLGKPIVADPFMPAVNTGATAVGFGDFAQFFVRLVGGVRFERSDDFLFNQDLVAFRAILRGDGTLVDLTGAVKTLKSPLT